ncbi:MAG TPA: hypothetical protein EYQ28_07580 [Henriciella sp.]|nr:hypothetical protein [Henriciella sp.]
MQKRLLRRIYKSGPMLFGLGFLTPLAAQLLIASNMSLPFGMSPLLAGFLLAMALAVPAQIRGRWI